MTSRFPLTLFIIKKSGYGDIVGSSNFGLRIATEFIVNMLHREGHRVNLADAVDANCIHRLIREAGTPSIVILEALWVSPAKMRELMDLNPTVRFVVRINSELPFLASEGVGVEWLAQFMDMGVDVAFNSLRTADDFGVLGDSLYLPNSYPLRRLRSFGIASDHVSVGCFGAVRTLKNQLEQAFAAVRYANEAGQELHFHMNASDDEHEAAPILKSIHALMHMTDNRLVLHPWLAHVDFLDLVSNMDICLQVSMSESFNIVAADSVSMGVPTVGSDAVHWLPQRSKARVDSAASICAVMKNANAAGVEANHTALREYVDASVAQWNAFMDSLYV